MCVHIILGHPEFRNKELLLVFWLLEACAQCQSITAWFEGISRIRGHLRNGVPGVTALLCPVLQRDPFLLECWKDFLLCCQPLLLIVPSQHYRRCHPEPSRFPPLLLTFLADDVSFGIAWVSVYILISMVLPCFGLWNTCWIIWQSRNCTEEFIRY